MTNISAKDALSAIYKTEQAQPKNSLKNQHLNQDSANVNFQEVILNQIAQQNKSANSQNDISKKDQALIQAKTSLSKINADFTKIITQDFNNSQPDDEENKNQDLASLIRQQLIGSKFSFSQQGKKSVVNLASSLNDF